MSSEPESSPDYSQVVAAEQPRSTDTKQLPSGTFVGREEEQDRFRAMLQEMVGGRKGFLSGFLGGKSAKVAHAIKSRVLLISGPAGSGKTRLAQRLRDIAQKEKEFARRFRTTRLDWQELFERDGRLMALLEGEPVPPDAVLDILQTHCGRDNGGGYFEEYRTAVAETKKLVGSVQGAELSAVWEFRARALGRSLAEWSSERYLIFFLENFQLVASALETILQPMLEESGPQVFFVITGESEPIELGAAVVPERFAALEPSAFHESELRDFYELELARYETLQSEEQIDFSPAYRSPDLIAQLAALTGSMPLAARFSAFMLQTGLTVQDLTSSHPPGGVEAVAALVEQFLSGPLGPGHPDRLRLYGLAVLRRPEPGLLSALFDTRKDMLSVDEMLNRVNERYAFLFEPGRSMTLHNAVCEPLRRWLLEPGHRYDENGLAKVNQHGLDYLTARLEEWSVNFPALREQVGDLKWREWALDKTWHAFWLSEERGWPEALALLTAGLAYRPAFARQLVAMLESLVRLGLLNETGLRRAQLFREVVINPAQAQAQLRELRVMGEEGGFFRAAMPRFERELIEAINQL